MKNPQNGDWYLLAINKDTHFITVTYSPRGIARAWLGYSDTVLSTAGGYGYDKESSVLADACAKQSNIKELREAMGVGIGSLKKLINDRGGKLYDRQGALDLIYKDIKVNKY